MRKIPVVVPVLAIALWLPLLLALFGLGGCESGTSGPIRPLSPSAEHTITNTVTLLTSGAVQTAPQPYSAAIEAGGAAVLALLAAWQGLTHSRVTKLRSDSAATEKDTPP